MANEAVFRIDVQGLDKLREAGDRWKGISKGGAAKVQVSGAAAAGGSFGGVAQQWRKMGEEDAARKAKLFDQSKKLWKTTSMTMQSFTRSLMSWSKWAVAGVAGGLFGLGRLAQGVRADMFQGRATGTNTATVKAWDVAFKSAGLGSEGSGVQFLRAIREMQTDIQKQIYFAQLGMKTGTGLAKEDTEKMALEFMERLRSSTLPAALKDEMAQAVGLSRLDIERMKGGEFSGYLRGAKEDTAMSEGQAQKVAAFALQLDRLTESIKNNVILIMAKYSKELTAFVDKMNKAAREFAQYILSGQMEDDLRNFGYALKYWADKWIPGYKAQTSDAGYMKYVRTQQFLEKQTDLMDKTKLLTSSGLKDDKAAQGQMAEKLARNFMEVLNRGEMDPSVKRRAAETFAGQVLINTSGRYTFAVDTVKPSSESGVTNVTMKLVDVSSSPAQGKGY